MDDFSQATFETGKEILRDTSETVGEQLGTKREKGYTQNAKEQFNFWEEFKEQIFHNKSPEQIQKEAAQAQQGEKFKSPEQLAEARKRLQELNTPTPMRANAYEYRGPQVPTQQDNSSGRFESHSTQVPQRPTPSALDHTKQGSNEMMKKMVG